MPFLHINDPLGQLKKAFRYDQIGGLLDLKHLDEKASYLYYKDVAGKQYVFHTEHLPSQYMRRLLAQAMRCDNWDWRQCDEEEDVLATVTEVSTVLAHSSTATE